MLLLLLALTVTLAGLVAIELGQAPRPREYSVWNDDLERRLLRIDSGSRDRR